MPTISQSKENFEIPKSIVVNDLEKVFSGEKNSEHVIAVDKISFAVKRGELFGLLGPNGAGKSTTIKMLTGLLKPTKGSIEVEGYNLKDMNKAKALIGVCPQEAAVSNTLTGLENIELFGNLYLMPKKEISERAENFLKMLGLYEARKRKAKGYSGGMMRQLNLIISLINDPKILFLDEPTVGMDPRVRRKTWEFVQDLKENNKTIILTTHYMEEAEKLCDRVAIIDYGKILDIGTPMELIKKYETENLEGVFLKITGRRILEGMY